MASGSWAASNGLSSRAFGASGLEEEDVSFASVGTWDVREDPRASEGRRQADDGMDPLLWKAAYKVRPRALQGFHSRIQDRPKAQATVSAIPDQTIAEGGSFTAINLDNYVTDPTYTPADMVWTYSGNTSLSVTIVNRVATIGIPNPHWNGAETITFRATPPDGLWDEKAATFTVTPVNDPPTDISLSNNSVAENLAVNTVVGTFATTDPDVGDTFTYSLESGAGSGDNVSFNISGNSLLTSAVFDFETKSSYSVRVRSTDQGGLWFEKVFLITIININEAPTDIGLSNNAVAENSAVNTVVGNLSSVDPDSGNTFTYTLVSGSGSTDNSSFNIAGASLRTSAIFNFGTKNSYLIRIRSTDQGGLWVEKQFAVSVTYVDTVKPTVTWVAPVGDGQGYYLNDRFVRLLVIANDNVGVAEVKFFRWDKQLLRYFDLGIQPNPPYEWNFDTTLLYYGWNEIDVNSYDAAGNVSDTRFIFLFRKATLYLPLIASR